MKGEFQLDVRAWVGRAGGVGETMFEGDRLLRLMSARKLMPSGEVGGEVGAVV
jgi:hypothetical protein